MTYLQIQDRVMARLNLTSTDARNRIKLLINDRYREVQSSVGLGRTRRGTKNFLTTSGSSTTTASGIAKIFTLYDATYLKRPLKEISLPTLRMTDADSSVKGTPREFAVKLMANDVITLQLYPQPVVTSGVLVADCLITATDLSASGDIPSLPLDFHDVIVKGVVAEELRKMEKMRPLADDEEARYEKRLSELRYFLAKSSYLVTKQTDHDPIQNAPTTLTTIV